MSWTPTIASGPRTQLIYIAETVVNTTPTTPTMKVLRATDRKINLKKTLLQSKEIRVDRQIKDERHGFNSIDGMVGFELMGQSYDDFLEACLSGTWVAVTTAGSPNLAAGAGTPGTITRAAGSWIADGYRAGDIITTAGFATSGNNQSNLRILSLTATVLTVDGTLTTDASGSGPTVVYPGKRLDIGTLMRTFSIERQSLDISQYQLFRGVSVNQMDLKIMPQAIATGSFTLLGISAAAMAGSTAASATTAAPTTTPYDSFDGVMYEAGAQIAYVTGLEFTVANGQQLGGVVGSRYSPEVFEGQASITGTLHAFFKNATLYNKFVNETESSMWLRLNDPDGTNFMNIVFPRVKYNDAPIEPAAEGPVVLNMPFRAMVDSVSLTSLSIQRSNT